MLDNMCPKTETDKLSVQSDEESLNENDSLKEFVVDGGEDDNLEDETKVNRTRKGKGTDTALSSKETSQPSHAIQKVVTTTQKRQKQIRLAKRRRRTHSTPRPAFTTRTRACGWKRPMQRRCWRAKLPTTQK